MQNATQTNATVNFCERISLFKIKKSEPVPGVIYLKFKNQYETCSTFMRMQEFYESPFKEIRGKLFSLERFMDLYAEQQGNFTYTTDWGGFNVPGHVVDKFYGIFYDSLMAKEWNLYNAIWGDSKPRQTDEKYYVIGMYDESNLDHELCHAVYYLNDEYRAVVKTLVKGLPQYVSEPIKKWLLKKGYSKPLVLDETHAYLSTSGKDELTKRFGKRVGNRYDKFAAFRDAYMKYSGRKLPAASWLVEVGSDE